MSFRSLYFTVSISGWLQFFSFVVVVVSVVVVWVDLSSFVWGGLLLFLFEGVVLFLFLFLSQGFHAQPLTD